jgi:cytochrome P450
MVRDIHEDVADLTFSIITCAFGRAFSAIPTAQQTVHDAMRFISEKTQYRLLNLVGTMPVLRSLPLWGKPQLDRSKAVMFTVVERAIRERQSDVQLGLDDQHDLLDLLLNAKDVSTGNGLSPAEVRDEAMTFVLAGHDTTSNLLTWMLHALMIRPALWDECAAEALAVCGRDPPRYDQLSQLPVLDAVVNETLRLFPPVPIIQKEAITDHTLCSDAASSPRQQLHVKRGSQLHIDIHVIHRLKEYWGDSADTFDHTRWLSTVRPYSHPFAFLPFSAGTRNCIGQNFALMEAKVVMVLLLQHVRMQFVPGQAVDAAGAPVHTSIVTLRPKYGVKAIISMCA